MSKIKIGKFSFDYPVFPAPMCGIMDAPFRAMILKFGTPLVYTEMIASHATILQCRKEYIKQATLKETDKIPFVVQIAGCDPDIMATAVSVAVDRGADIVDLNFGCPVKKIVNNFAGSALMKDEQLARKIIEAVAKEAKKMNIPVTIKMRIGWDEQHKNAVNIAKIAENEGVETVTIHCRTRMQMYSGKADWEFAKTLKNSINIPVIVNGDINLQNIDIALKTSNADGAMIGRALYGKPWLIADCISYLKHERKTHKPTDIWNCCIKEHLDRIFDFYPIANAIGFAIKNLYFYSQGIENSSNFRSLISKCKTKKEILLIAEDFFIKPNTIFDLT